MIDQQQMDTLRRGAERHAVYMGMGGEEIFIRSQEMVLPRQLVLELLDEIKRLTINADTWAETCQGLEEEKERLEKLLPHLVDVVWGNAHEDVSVPCSKHARRLIEHAKKTLDDPEITPMDDAPPPTS